MEIVFMGQGVTGDTLRQARLIQSGWFSFGGRVKNVQSLPPLGDGAPVTGCTQADLDAAHIYVAEDQQSE